MEFTAVLIMFSAGVDAAFNMVHSGWLDPHFWDVAFMWHP
jgi:hypothetical protein